eukprot:2503314-Pyramimonas_sp.AAC.1
MQSAFIGDVAFASREGAQFIRKVDVNMPIHEHVSQILEGADFTIANLESSVVAQSTWRDAAVPSSGEGAARPKGYSIASLIPLAHVA